MALLKIQAPTERVSARAAGQAAPGIAPGRWRPSLWGLGPGAPPPRTAVPCAGFRRIGQGVFSAIRLLHSHLCYSLAFVSNYVEGSKRLRIRDEQGALWFCESTTHTTNFLNFDQIFTVALTLDGVEVMQPGRWIFASTRTCKRSSKDNNDQRPDTKRSSPTRARGWIRGTEGRRIALISYRPMLTFGAFNRAWSRGQSRKDHGRT